MLTVNNGGCAAGIRNFPRIPDKAAELPGARSPPPAIQHILYCHRHCKRKIKYKMISKDSKSHLTALKTATKPKEDTRTQSLSSHLSLSLRTLDNQSELEMLRMFAADSPSASGARRVAAGRGSARDWSLARPRC